MHRLLVAGAPDLAVFADHTRQLAPSAIIGTEDTPDLPGIPRVIYKLRPDLWATQYMDMRACSAIVRGRATMVVVYPGGVGSYDIMRRAQQQRLDIYYV